MTGLTPPPAGVSNSAYRVATALALMAADHDDKAGNVKARDVPEDVTEDVLTTATGLSPSRLRAALKQLSEAGWEFRVVINKDRNGAPIFGREGAPRRFQIPQFAALRAARFRAPGAARLGSGTTRPFSGGSQTNFSEGSDGNQHANEQGI